MSIEWTTGKKKAKKEGDWKVAKKDVKTWKEKRLIGVYEKDDQKEWKTVTVQQLCC